jgi:hypothetical protein
MARRVVAEVERYPGELHPGVDFIVTKRPRLAAAAPSPTPFTDAIHRRRWPRGEGFDGINRSG